MGIAAVSEFEQRVEAGAAVVARKALFQWRRVAAADISGQWSTRLPHVEALVSAAMVDAALEGSTYAGAVLAVQGEWVAPDVIVNPSGFGRSASSGVPLGQVLSRPVSYSKQLIGSGVAPAIALEQAGRLLVNITRSQVQDASRAAASVDVAARSGVGYVRMVGPGSCSRCIILAGKWFRWNQGFKRHPNCNCTHQPTQSTRYEAALAEGYIDDPYVLFKSLSPLEQAKAFGEANARAIRDGADIYQVVNSSRGARGLYTSSGTSKRGYSASLAGKRLTPDAIYSMGLPRARALELLEQHNYILPGGQVPGGSIRVQASQGFGSLGAGGRRKAASAEFARAVQSGVRDPNSLYTMTAAEYRLANSRLRYEAVLEGRNPFSQSRPLTPDIAARVEREFKRWLATGGEKFL